MPLTTDPSDPRLGRGADTKPGPQNEVYLVLSEEERAKGFVRPYRDRYIHRGKLPKYPIRPVTSEEKELWQNEYVAFEPYPDGSIGKGRFWTQSQLDRHGCGTETIMGRELSETYARDPNFYGQTYCVGCQMHLPVDEFVWSADGEVVGS
jgi:hypothetical protein